MENYIFLDIDGVLNHRGTRAKAPYDCPGISAKHLDVLKQIVEMTDAKIVLISDWRLSFLPGDHMPEMAAYITKMLEKKGLGFELVSCEHRYQDRPEQIRNWLHAHPAKGFVILDDEDFSGYLEPDMAPHWIRIDPVKGLLPEHIREAVSRMSVQPRQESPEA